MLILWKSWLFEFFWGWQFFIENSTVCRRSSLLLLSSCSRYGICNTSRKLSKDTHRLNIKVLFWCRSSHFSIPLRCWMPGCLLLLLWDKLNESSKKNCLCERSEQWILVLWNSPLQWTYSKNKYSAPTTFEFLRQKCSFLNHWKSITFSRFTFSH